MISHETKFRFMSCTRSNPTVMGSVPNEATKKLRAITLEDKMVIIAKHEEGWTNKQICENFNRPHSSISGITKNKAKIRQAYNYLCSVQGSTKKKKYNGVEDAPFERALYYWLRQKWSSGVLISGVLLREQAIVFHRKIYGSSNFSASAGWIDNFQKRHNLRHLKVKDEKLSADPEICLTFSNDLISFIEENRYELKNVYNADETGLMYRTLPDKTENEVPGYKPIKDRITIMTCSNATGDDRIPLMAIGKSVKPQCFKGVVMPIHYRHQKKAWTNTDIFLDWYKTIFLPHVTKRDPNAKFLLLLDNSPTHPPAHVLNAIDERCFVMYLPLNVTSIIQPMDQGPISSMKRHYKTAFLRELLSKNCKDKSSVIAFVKQWSLVDCFHVIHEAWNCLSQGTLSNAWKNIISGISSVSMTPENTISDTQIVELLNKIPDSQTYAASDVRKWCKEDENLQIEELMSDDEILNVYAGLHLPIEDHDKEEEGDFEDSVDSIYHYQKFAVSPPEILDAATRILHWSRHNPEFSTEERQLFVKARNVALQSILDANKAVDYY